jgi:DNA-binding beta-propeller fold protein YncE
MSAFSRIKLLMLACFFLLAFDASAWDRGKVERFATLPRNSPNPEGIAVDSRNGDVYVTGFMPTEPAGPGKVFVFDREGDRQRTLLVSGSSNALLGIDFHPDTHELLVVDFGGGKVLRVNPFSGASTVFTAPVGAAGLNALAFDSAGNVYISDSGRGTIWRTSSGGGAAEDWVTSPLLGTTGFPPFGANGLDFSRDGSFLFVANTGDDTILRVHTATSPRVVEPFTNSINGADGLFVDQHDNIWVCANQSDEIVVLDKTGKAISKLGDFNGVRNGSPVGLLFPASLARHGDWIYITNLSLDTRTIGLPQSVDSQWAAKVKRHTISRIRARILGFERGDDD